MSYAADIPAIAPATLRAAVEAARGMNPDAECVHIRADGSVSTGTDGRTTTPSEWSDIVALYHPWLAEEPWECLRSPIEGIRGPLARPGDEDDDEY